MSMAVIDATAARVGWTTRRTVRGSEIPALVIGDSQGGLTLAGTQREVSGAIRRMAGALGEVIAIPIPPYGPEMYVDSHCPTTNLAETPRFVLSSAYSGSHFRPVLNALAALQLSVNGERRSILGYVHGPTGEAMVRTTDRHGFTDDMNLLDLRSIHIL